MNKCFLCDNEAMTELCEECLHPRKEETMNLYLLKVNEEFIRSGRPSTIRVYESIESARKGIEQLRRNYEDEIKIVEIKSVEEID